MSNLAFRTYVSWWFDSRASKVHISVPFTFVGPKVFALVQRDFGSLVLRRRGTVFPFRFDNALFAAAMRHGDVGTGRLVERRKTQNCTEFRLDPEGY